MIDNIVKHNEKRREAIQRDIDKFLDAGKMIEVLTQPELRKQPEYTFRDFSMRKK